MITTSKPEFLTLPDGRQLCYQQYGAPQGDPVIYAHGAPSCRLECAIFDEAAKKFGFRMIATDRPGFGQSDFQPGRRWNNYVEDIEQLTAHLVIDSFGHIGWSGGGPPTLAVARYIPQRLDFAISLAGQPPLESPEDVDLLNQADQVAISLLHKSPLLFRSFFKIMSAMEKHSPNAMYETYIKSSNAYDANILNQTETKAWFNDVEAEAFRQGAKGVAWDAEIDYEDMGFRAAEIDYPVHVFQGDADNYVTYELQKKLVANMPNGELHFLPGKGHFFPVEMPEDILTFARKLKG